MHAPNHEEEGVMQGSSKARGRSKSGVGNGSVSMPQVAKLNAVEPHPNADSLKVCSVETRSGSFKVSIPNFLSHPDSCLSASVNCQNGHKHINISCLLAASATMQFLYCKPVHCKLVSAALLQPYKYLK